MIKKIKDNKAFTLIELIVVVGIIGILVGIASPRFTGYTEKARIAKHSSNAKALESSIEVFNIENDRFPRLSEIAYTADDVKGFSKSVRDLEGKEVTLDADGKYYDLDYLAINDSISIPDNERASYILQNPKGKIFYLENLTEEGLSRDDFGSTNPNNNISSGGENTEVSEIIKIKSGRQLARIGKDDRYPLSGKYIQKGDIDLSGCSNWTPIGSPSHPFSGEYDGNGHVIKNISVKHDDYSGLFGYAKDSKIENIGLMNVDIEGTSRVGGLIGHQDNSLVNNSYVYGIVSGVHNVGGVVGRQHNSSVKNSYSDGNFSASGDQVGGLVGGQYLDSSVVNSYSFGDVLGSRYNIGGLVGGQNASIISNSYATGSVSGDGISMGGLVGYQHYSTVENSYSIGEVSGGSNVGGLSGNIGNSKFISSYYNKEVYREDVSNKGVGKTTAEMKVKITYKDWDFNNIWKIGSNGYPELQWQK